ncbi:MAG: hypothetical protein ACI4NC_03395 [Succinivibrio sp.]
MNIQYLIAGLIAIFYCGFTSITKADAAEVNYVPPKEVAEAVAEILQDASDEEYEQVMIWTCQYAEALLPVKHKAKTKADKI